MSAHGLMAEIHDCDAIPIDKLRRTEPQDGTPAQFIHFNDGLDRRERDTLQRVTCRMSEVLLYVRGDPADKQTGLHVIGPDGFYRRWRDTSDRERMDTAHRMLTATHEAMLAAARIDSREEISDVGAEYIERLMLQVKSKHVRELASMLESHIANDPAAPDATTTVDADNFDRVAETQILPLRPFGDDPGGGLTVRTGRVERLSPEQVAEWRLVKRGNAGLMDIQRPFEGEDPDVDLMMRLLREHVPAAWIDTLALAVAFPALPALHVWVGRSGTGKGFILEAGRLATGLIDVQSSQIAGDGAAQHFSATTEPMGQNILVALDEGDEMAGPRRMLTPGKIAELLGPEISVNPKGAARYKLARTAQLLVVANDWPSFDPSAKGNPRRLHLVYHDGGKLQKLAPTLDDDDPGYLTQQQVQRLLASAEAQRYLLLHVVQRAAELAAMGLDAVREYLREFYGEHRRAFIDAAAKRKAAVDSGRGDGFESYDAGAAVKRQRKPRKGRGEKAA